MKQIDLFESPNEEEEPVGPSEKDERYRLLEMYRKDGAVSVPTKQEKIAAWRSAKKARKDLLSALEKRFGSKKKKTPDTKRKTEA